MTCVVRKSACLFAQHYHIYLFRQGKILHPQFSDNNGMVGCSDFRLRLPSFQTFFLLNSIQDYCTDYIVFAICYDMIIVIFSLLYTHNKANQQKKDLKNEYTFFLANTPT